LEGEQRCTREGTAFDCGDEATAVLLRIVGARTSVCWRKDTDRNGRAVGRCSVDGEDVGALLVREGWALDYRRYSGGHRRAQEARSRGKAGAGCGPRRSKTPGTGATAIVAERRRKLS
jgi:endonuclease YncB( thermonuclease family)